MRATQDTYALDPTTNVRRWVRAGSEIPDGWEPEDPAAVGNDEVAQARKSKASSSRRASTRKPKAS
jgi:hypothetical protein